MTLDSRYVVTSDVDTYFVDKDSGQPLANGTLKFYKDSERTIPKPVYQLTGAPPSYSYASLGSSITLSNAGTVQNAGGDNILIYYYPYKIDSVSGKEVLDLYFIECRDQDGNIMFTREAWPNLSDGSGDTQDLTAPLQNQISNPQFTNVFFDPQPGSVSQIDLVSDNDREIPISPDWMIIASGTGSIQVSRNIISGSNQFRTNPPYSLKITNGVGVNNVKLVQRFRKNSGLWTSTTDSDIYLSGSFLARNEIGGTQTIGLYYRESTPGYTPILVSSGSFDSVYTYIEGGTSSAIPSSSDPDLGDDGYIDIFLNIPDNSSISLTSINLIPSFKKNTKPPYSLDSSNRNESYQGDWYIPRLSDATSDSLLIGWDFAVNPWQFGSKTDPTNIVPDRNNSKYMLDQTIMFSETVSTWRTTTVTNIPSLALSKSVPDNKPICLMQYLDYPYIERMLHNNLSVNLVFNSDQPVTFFRSESYVRVYLFFGTSITSLPGVIGNVNSDGTFTLSDPNWFEYKNVRGSQRYKINNTRTEIKINGWEKNNIPPQPPNPANHLKYFCIVVTLEDTFMSNTNRYIIVDSISLVQGDIPYQPSPKTITQTLSDCQYYYQKSFPVGVFPANGTLFDGSSYGLQYTGASTVSTGPIVSFPTEMRSVPQVVLYNPINNDNQIYNPVTSSSWSLSNTGNIGKRGFYAHGTTPPGSAQFQSSLVHWTADARLGVVP